MQPMIEGKDGDQESYRPANDQRGQGQGQGPAPSLAHDFPVQQQQLSDDFGEEDDSQIKCICGFNEDDGNTVACNICNKWKHIMCYYPQNIDSFDELQHGCTECRPETLVNAQAAHVRQREVHAALVPQRETQAAMAARMRHRLKQGPTVTFDENPRASRADLVNPGMGEPLSGTGSWTNTDRERPSSRFGKGKEL
jgi:hypothetical protein